MGQVVEHVGAEEEHQLAIGLGGAQHFERIDRIARTTTASFQVRYAKGWVARRGEFQHLHAQRDARLLPLLLVRRPCRRQEPNLIEAKLLARTLGQQEMSVVNRVEATAQQT